MTWSTKIKLETLTPLWTGGVDGKVDRIHETAIIGSLRWWFEALVRGVGGHACDPTKHECQFDMEKYRKNRKETEREKLQKAGLCDVCQVFGATGWRRRFYLYVSNQKIDLCDLHNVKADRTYEIKGREKTPTWYFNDTKAIDGEFYINLKSYDFNFDVDIVKNLIERISINAGIGARTQMGFGIVKCIDDPADPVALRKWLNDRNGLRNYPSLPNIQHMFFAKISPKNEGGKFSDADTFNIKYDLRRLFANNSQLRHFIMGTVKDKSITPEGRMAAKIHVSRPYDDGKEIRVWGWIPETSEFYTGNWNQQSIVGNIKTHFNYKYEVKSWIDFQNGVSVLDCILPEPNHK